MTNTKKPIHLFLLFSTLIVFLLSCVTELRASSSSNLGEFKDNDNECHRDYKRAEYIKFLSSIIQLSDVEDKFSLDKDGFVTLISPKYVIIKSRYYFTFKKFEDQNSILKISKFINDEKFNEINSNGILDIETQVSALSCFAYIVVDIKNIEIDVEGNYALNGEDCDLYIITFDYFLNPPNRGSKS